MIRRTCRFKPPPLTTPRSLSGSCVAASGAVVAVVAVVADVADVVAVEPVVVVAVAVAVTVTISAEAAAVATTAGHHTGGRRRSLVNAPG